MSTSGRIRVIAFNGPPGSGKDAIANQLAMRIDEPCYVRALAYPLRQWAMSIVGFNAQEIADDAQYAAFKTMNFLRGGETITGRQLMIDLSEKFFKPNFGQDFWARKELDSFIYTSEIPTTVLITDLGFSIEAEAFKQDWKVDEFHIIQLERAGCDWTHDSRGNVWIPGVRTFRLQNNSTLENITDILGGYFGINTSV